MFDIVAPWFGGLRIMLAVEPARAGARTGKPCPKCGARVRVDRSFCPSCDHSFADAP